MRLILLIFALGLPAIARGQYYYAAAAAGGGGGNTYTLVQSPSDIDEDSSATTIALTVSATGAGRLLAVWLKWEGTTTVTGVSDGTSSFTAGTATTHSNNDMKGQWWYLLSSNSGKTSITATFSGSTPYRRIFVWEFSATGSPAFDTQNTGTGTTGGTGSIASGSITTNAGAGLVLGGYAAYSSASMTSPLVAGNAATFDRAGGISECVSWYYLTSGTVTGTASVTMSGAHEWIVNAIAFK